MFPKREEIPQVYAFFFFFFSVKERKEAAESRGNNFDAILAPQSSMNQVQKKVTQCKKSLCTCVMAEIHFATFVVTSFATFCVTQ